MRLSDAIRLGSILRPQGFGDIHQTVKKWFQKKETVTCALGAAIEAAGITVGEAIPGSNIVGSRGEPDNRPGYIFPKEWSFSFLYSQCPVCGIQKVIIQQISHLNDTHRWTRERIADWVETVEPARAMTEDACLSSSSR